MEKIDLLFSYMNTINPCIQYTYEASTNKVSFLDLWIHRNTTDKRLEFSLFIKPSSVGIFTNAKSYHPRNQLYNIAKNEIHRAIKNSSTSELEEQSIKLISDVLSKNSFTERTIDKLIRDCRRGQVLRKSSAPKTADKTNFLVLPYLGEKLKRKTVQTLENYGLADQTHLVLTSGPKIKDALTKNRLNPAPCNKKSAATCYDCNDNCMVKNIVYLLTCTLCDAQYVGESGRPKRHRIWEHYRSVINGSTSTAMGAHFASNHRGVIPTRPFEVEILKTCKDYVDRQLQQAVYITHLQPALNTQLASSA